jgi:hypothetical protein
MLGVIMDFFGEISNFFISHQTLHNKMKTIKNKIKIMKLPSTIIALYLIFSKPNPIQEKRQRVPAKNLLYANFNPL